MRLFAAVSVVILLFANQARGFALLGPHEDWMQWTNGFRLPGDIGGPMSLGSEYRWNVPVLTYAFDQSFLDYFGTNGVAAVEDAIKMLNDLPAASQVDPSNYPPTATRWASAYGLLDLKSQALFLLLEQLGLTQPVRSTFCVRDFTHTNGVLTSVSLVQRNFDPITLQPSSCVNDSCFTTNHFDVNTDGTNIYVSVVPELVDPFKEWLPSVSDGMAYPVRALMSGSFYDSLTRDDVGGVRYLLHTNNLNVELLLPGVHGIGTNASSYAVQALRGGVDKITFVRPAYDLLLGRFFSSFTNQFTDRYFTNGTFREQQLERVVNEPDILFSAKTPDQPAQYEFVERTGTCNWTNLGGINGVAGAAGPGLIRPSVRINFFKLGILVQSGDGALATYTSLDDFQWGTFAGTTNAPMTYPIQSALESTRLNVHLQFFRNGTGETRDYDWSLPSSIGDRIALQSSTNYTDWVSIQTVTNRGVQVFWRHVWEMTQHQRFFRLKPQ